MMVLALKTKIKLRLWSKLVCKAYTMKNYSMKTTLYSVKTQRALNRLQVLSCACECGFYRISGLVMMWAMTEI